MKFAFSNRSVRQYGKLSAVVQARFDKQLGFLLSNLQHPSLRAKKYDEAENVWQAPRQRPLPLLFPDPRRYLSDS